MIWVLLVVAIWLVCFLLLLAWDAMSRSPEASGGSGGFFASLVELRRLAGHEPTVGEILASRPGRAGSAAAYPEAFLAAARRAANGTLTGDADAAEIAEESGAPLSVVFAAISAALAEPPREVG